MVALVLRAELFVLSASYLFSMRNDLPVLAAGTALHEIYLVYARLRNALRIVGANSAIRYDPGEPDSGHGYIGAGSRP